jgi:hypothetical protein
MLGGPSSPAGTAPRRVVGPVERIGRPLGACQADPDRARGGASAGKCDHRPRGPDTSDTPDAGSCFRSSPAALRCVRCGSARSADPILLTRPDQPPITSPITSASPPAPPSCSSSTLTWTTPGSAAAVSRSPGRRGCPARPRPRRRPALPGPHIHRQHPVRRAAPVLPHAPRAPGCATPAGRRGTLDWLAEHLANTGQRRRTAPVRSPTTRPTPLPP